MNVELRSVKTPAEQALADAFASARARLPGKGAVAALREEAFKLFDAKGLPHRRVEEWKYTDLRALMREALPLAAPPDAAAKDKGKTAGQMFSGVHPRRLVFVDGVFLPEQSDLTPEKGLTLGSLAEALGKGDALVAKHVGTTVQTDDVAVALNTALMGDGAVVHVAAGTRLARPIHLVFAGSKPASIFTRSLVVVEKGAEAVLIESHETGAAQTNSTLELVVGDEAKVEHFKMICAPALHLGSLLASIGAKASFDTFAFTLDSQTVRNQMFVKYAGEGTRSNIRGVTLLKDKQHVDTTLLIDHAAAGCESREQFRSVVDGESHAIFQGKIVVRPGAQKTDAKMMTRALLLSDDAEADNKPELEIFADDVVCGHGATAGALDKELKFYLKSRGIPEKEAEALLIQAFADEVIETIPHEGIRQALLVTALRWLGARQ